MNVPNLPRQLIKGVMITRTADVGFVKASRIQGNNVMNYTLEMDNSFFNNATEGTDIRAIHSGYISISLLQFEVNHRDVMPSITECVQKIKDEILGISSVTGNS